MNYEKPAHKKVNTFISFLVLAAAFAIILFKLAGCSKSNNTVNSSSVTPISQVVKSVGEVLPSLSVLNTVAATEDTVFILVPKSDNNGIKAATAKSLNNSKKKLEAKGKTIGLYTLKVDSPDYSNISAKSSLPAVLVMSKGKRKKIVTGEINESRLLQAYVAVSQRAQSGGGCSCNKGGSSKQTCGQ